MIKWLTKFIVEKYSVCGTKSSALGSKKIAIIEEGDLEVVQGPVSFQTVGGTQQ